MVSYSYEYYSRIFLFVKVILIIKGIQTYYSAFIYTNIGNIKNVLNYKSKIVYKIVLRALICGILIVSIKSNV